MKSPMVKGASYIKEDDKGRYTDLMVLRSAAGWYVGTLYNDPAGFQDAGSRDSDYFATEAEAAEYLRQITEEDAPTRLHP